MTIDDLLAKWLGARGGAERANYQMFLTEFCLALGLPLPDAAGSGLGDYRFDGPVRSEAIYGTKGDHRIDLYKRDCFILEAKQRQVRPGEAPPEDPPAPPPVPLFDLFGNPVGYEEAPAPKRRYDRLMEDARMQAQRQDAERPQVRLRRDRRDPHRSDGDRHRPAGWRCTGGPSVSRANGVKVGMWPIEPSSARQRPFE